MSGLILLLAVLIVISLVRALARSMRVQDMPGVQPGPASILGEERVHRWPSTTPPAATASPSRSRAAPPRAGAAPTAAITRPARRAAASAGAPPLIRPTTWARELLRRDRDAQRGAVVLRTILGRPRSLEPYDPD
jgi:hypothetical protein